ncbi:MAG TPA: NUDIX domain-containing protein [Planctomycetota bacterium]|jgi:8-oxo-dGTP diphosphatase|nr:NUDIX domain-containing protein [Planctomycetota bacterium]
MKDWRDVAEFGARPEAAPCAARPSAYGLFLNDRGELAVVRTAEGTCLPGGGIERGETPAAALAREAIEKCGLAFLAGAFLTRAVQFVYSESEGTHFEKRSTFFEA